jgi:hypothetical protein
MVCGYLFAYLRGFNFAYEEDIVRASHEFKI